ncbi:MAG: glucose-6-phosphate dehydrogenase [Kiritimatiellia bacterium]
MTDNSLSIVVVGASGHLALHKLFPALFSLYSQDLLPGDFNIFGFARSKMDDSAFRRRVAERLTCRYVPDTDCEKYTSGFLRRCHYHEGQYGSADSFIALYDTMHTYEGNRRPDRLFYLAVPPDVFTDAARSIAAAGMVNCDADEPWSRVVTEKPFGKDRSSSDAMSAELAEVFTENQTFRIDHYLGKEIVQNLMVLRFANAVFEPLWNSRYIDSVQITWKENTGVEQRARYFDNYGIIRDVMQNHLMQIMALVAMEKPSSAAAGPVRDAKTAVLRSVQPPAASDFALGQYRAGNGHRAYVREDGVPANSTTPTFAAAVFKVNNPRWKNVPFALCAGKGTDERLSEVRIRFNAVPENIFCPHPACLPPNELVIRIQPDEGIRLSVINKVPGLETRLAGTDLDLSYSAAFGREIPDAYERLLLDVISGDRSLFIRSDELAAAWDIFTPALHGIEKSAVKPEPYEFGAPGPASAMNLLREQYPPVSEAE